MFYLLSFLVITYLYCFPIPQIIEIYNYLCIWFG